MDRYSPSHPTDDIDDECYYDNMLKGSGIRSELKEKSPTDNSLYKKSSPLKTGYFSKRKYRCHRSKSIDRSSKYQSRCINEAPMSPTKYLREFSRSPTPPVIQFSRSPSVASDRLSKSPKTSFLQSHSMKINFDNDKNGQYISLDNELPNNILADNSNEQSLTLEKPITFDQRDDIFNLMTTLRTLPNDSSPKKAYDNFDEVTFPISKESLSNKRYLQNKSDIDIRHHSGESNAHESGLNQIEDNLNDCNECDNDIDLRNNALDSRLIDINEDRSSFEIYSVERDKERRQINNTEDDNWISIDGIMHDDVLENNHRYRDQQLFTKRFQSTTTPIEKSKKRKIPWVETLLQYEPNSKFSPNIDQLPSELRHYLPHFMTQQEAEEIEWEHAAGVNTKNISSQHIDWEHATQVKSKDGVPSLATRSSEGEISGNEYKSRSLDDSVDRENHGSSVNIESNKDFQIVNNKMDVLDKRDSQLKNNDGYLSSTISGDQSKDKDDDQTQKTVLNYGDNSEDEFDSWNQKDKNDPVIEGPHIGSQAAKDIEMKLNKGPYQSDKLKDFVTDNMIEESNSKELRAWTNKKMSDGDLSSDKMCRGRGGFNAAAKGGLAVFKNAQRENSEGYGYRGSGRGSYSMSRGRGGSNAVVREGIGGGFVAWKNSQELIEIGRDDTNEFLIRNNETNKGGTNRSSSVSSDRGGYYVAEQGNMTFLMDNRDISSEMVHLRDTFHGDFREDNEAQFMHDRRFYNQTIMHDKSGEFGFNSNVSNINRGCSSTHGGGRYQGNVGECMARRNTWNDGMEIDQQYSHAFGSQSESNISRVMDFNNQNVCSNEFGQRGYEPNMSTGHIDYDMTERRAEFQVHKDGFEAARNTQRISDTNLVDKSALVTFSEQLEKFSSWNKDNKCGIEEANNQINNVPELYEGRYDVWGNNSNVNHFSVPNPRSDNLMSYNDQIEGYQNEPAFTDQGGQQFENVYPHRPQYPDIVRNVNGNTNLNVPDSSLRYNDPNVQPVQIPINYNFQAPSWPAPSSHPIHNSQFDSPMFSQIDALSQNQPSFIPPPPPSTNTITHPAVNQNQSVNLDPSAFNDDQILGFKIPQGNAPKLLPIPTPMNENLPRSLDSNNPLSLSTNNQPTTSTSLTNTLQNILKTAASSVYSRLIEGSQQTNSSASTIHSITDAISMSPPPPPPTPLYTGPNSFKNVISSQPFRFVPPPLPVYAAVSKAKDNEQTDPKSNTKISDVIATTDKPSEVDHTKLKRVDFKTSFDWQERVAIEVKSYLKPSFISQKINKNDYKEIMKRCVTKISRSGVTEINSIKIGKFVVNYVEKYINNQSGTATNSKVSSSTNVSKK